LAKYYKVGKEKFQSIEKFINITTNSTYGNFFKGVSLFFAQNFASVSKLTYLDFSRYTDTLMSFDSSTATLIRHRKPCLTTALNLNYLKKIMNIKRKNPIKKKFFVNFSFRIKFLKKRFRRFRYLKGTQSLGKWKTSSSIRTASALFRKRNYFLNNYQMFFFLISTKIIFNCLFT
jgi:hypothetical protein